MVDIIDQWAALQQTGNLFAKSSWLSRQWWIINASDKELTYKGCFRRIKWKCPNGIQTQAALLEASFSKTSLLARAMPQMRTPKTALATTSATE